jgi:hypothetical protein
MLLEIKIFLFSLAFWENYRSYLQFKFIQLETVNLLYLHGINS